MSSPDSFSIAYPDEHLLVDRQAGGPRRSPGARPPRGHALATARRRAARRRPERPGSSTASTATPLGCSSSPAPRRPTGCCSGARRARDRARVPGARPGPPAGAHAARSRRRSAATRGAHAHGRRRRRPARGAHPLRARARPAGHSLLRVRLDTGRTHQIRVHLQAIGHPVCGDPEYGAAGVLGLERQFLHATRLAFEHPISGERDRGRSPLPRGPAGRARARRTAILRLVNQSSTRAVRIAALPGRRASPDGSATRRDGNSTTNKREQPWLK